VTTAFQPSTWLFIEQPSAELIPVIPPLLAANVKRKGDQILVTAISTMNLKMLRTMNVLHTYK
jgi:hypothetical protein